MRKLWAGAAVMLAVVGVLATPAEAKASKSCLAALEHADDLTVVSLEYSDAASGMLDAIGAAAQRASGSVLTSAPQFVNDIAAAAGTLRTSTSALDDRALLDRLKFNAAAKRCRAGK